MRAGLQVPQIEKFNNYDLVTAITGTAADMLVSEGLVHFVRPRQQVAGTVKQKIRSMTSLRTDRLQPRKSNRR